MLEALLVLGVIALLVLLGLAALFLSLEAILIAGIACIAAGFCVGVPAGAYYHFKLYRLLSTRGSVPRRFWFAPTRYHALLEPHEWRTIVPWFVTGGAGFLLIVLGCLIVLIGVFRS